MFKDHQTHKSKMSQGEEGGGEEGNEVHLGLPCGRQKTTVVLDCPKLTVELS